MSEQILLPTIDLAIEGDVEIDETAICELAGKAIRSAIDLAGLKFPDGAELSLLVTDDVVMQKLNCEWRNKDKPTNVLSFPGQDIRPGEPGETMLGDIVVSLETTKREADLENKALNAHLSHLIVHGFLHLFGYDHETDDEATIMESLERKVLANLGIKDPYEGMDAGSG